MDCPNLTMSPLKEIKAQYGEDAAYVANEIFSTEKFKEWYGSNEIPFMNDDFIIGSNAGSLHNIGTYLEGRGFKKQAAPDEYERLSAEQFGHVIDKADVKAINSILGKSKKNLNAKSIMTKLSNITDDPLMEKLSYAMMDKVGLNDKVVVKPLDDNEYMAFEEETDTIYINSNMIYDYGAKEFTSTFLHEMTHKYTAAAINNPSNKSEEEFAFKMKSLYETTKKFLPNTKDFEFIFGDVDGNNVHEFVSEVMTNKKFQDALKGMKFTVWQRIVNAISNLVGGSNTNNVYAEAVEAILNQVENYNFSAHYTNDKITTSVRLKSTTASADSKLTEETENQKKARETVENLETHIDSLDSALEAAIKNIGRKITKSTDPNENKDFVEDMTNLKKELERHRGYSSLKGLLVFSKNVLTQSEQIEIKLQQAEESGTLTDKLLFDTDEFLAAYDLVPTIIKEIEKEFPKKRFSDKETDALKEDGRVNVRGIRDKVIQKLESIEATRKGVIRARKILVENSAVAALSNESTIKLGEYRDKFEREANSLKFKGEEKENYIDRKLEENKEEIKTETQKFFRGLIKLTPRDLSSLRTLISDPGSLNSTTVQAVVNILNRSDLNTRKFTIEAKKSIAEAYLEYSKEHKESNLEKKYKNILGVDDKGNLNGRLISEYKSEFYNIYTNLTKDYLSAVEKEGLNSEFAKGLAIERSEWWKFNTEATEEGTIIPINKWKDPRYNKLSNSDKTYLDSVTASIRESDAKTPMFSRLNVSLKDLDTSWYKLPSIGKTDLERFYENKKDLFPGFIKDSLTKQADDTERNESIDETKNEYQEDLEKLGYTEVFSSELGAERHGVPIFFRGKIEPSKQSYDIPSILLANANMAENYKQKNLVTPTLELLREVTGDKKINKSEGLKDLVQINKADKTTTLKISGKDSNEYKVLSSILEDRLYGESTIDLKVTMNLFGNKIDANKLIGAVGAYTSKTMLMGNWLAGGVNLYQGKVQNFIEGVGGNIFDRSDLRSGEKEFWGDMKGWADDVGRPLKTSKTNLLLDLFNVAGDFEALSIKFANDNKFKALIKQDTLYATNHLGEYYIQSTLMYSTLKSIKVMNDKKQWIDKNGKVVSSKKDAASIDEMYTTDEKNKGQISLHPDVAYTSKNKISKYSELEMTNLLRKLSSDLHGQYDANMQSMAQRTVWGKLVYQLRKWLLRGVDRRWRGVSTATTKQEKLKTEDKYYSEDIREFEEGTYTTAIRFLSNLKKAGEDYKLSLLSTRFQELTDREQANIRKTVTEFSIYAMSFIAADLLLSLGEDEPDEDAKNLIFVNAYLMKRLSSEIGFYWNPAESLRIMKSPAASISMLEKSLKFIGQLTSPTEEYKTGNRKGQYKITKRTEDLIPLIRHFNDRYENIGESLSFLYHPV